MSNHIDFYYGLNSPWSFLGWDRLHIIAGRHSAGIAYYPLDFGVVFPATGGLPLPKRAPERQAYRMMELKRWKAHLGAEAFNIEPKFFPVDPGLATRMAIALRDQGGDVEAFSRAVLTAVWCEDRDIADAATAQALAEACGLDGAALLAAAEAPAAAERLAADSQAAIARGVFGAPSFVVGGEVFWGQDRLDFLDRALQAA